MPYERKIFHRDEKCLNCDYPIVGDYCGKCGQKAHIHKDSSWHMFLHFIADYFHYDNKFWRTIKTLFTSPGQITIDYIKGKRARYLNPIQLYIFVTTIFFLLFFTFFAPNSNMDSVIKIKQGIPKDSMQKNLTVGRQEVDSLITVNRDSLEKHKVKGLKPKYLTTYIEKQNKLPANLRDGKLKKYFFTKFWGSLQRLNETEGFQKKMSDNFFHGIPKMLFLLMPIFAFFLYLIYIRYKILYVDQLIFSLHFHSMLFLIYLITFPINYALSNFDIAIWIDFIEFYGILFYLYKSMRRVFPSSRAKTIFKFILLLTAYVVALFFVILLNGIWALVTI